MQGPDHKFPQDCRGSPAYQQQSGAHTGCRQKGILIECSDRFNIRMEEEQGAAHSILKTAHGSSE